ncbi:uncharacterized protein LOC110199380 [Phascolarctos cinereus]|uniref:Uncharacterized protein LOC110199380 isoform X2 n=1 Tax=Phascolarctos cinereus TaxID=38626 RepID=A0A6P5J690_PHACI|nr:uncharacterized protein LOC110199380 isoform X2 [Phascolarctos cinereus]
MLYLQIEAQRAKANGLPKEKELKYPEIRNASEKKERFKSAGSSVERGDSGRAEEKPGSPLFSSMLPDSEWVKLSPQEKLSWAKRTQDPRIAIGHQSPLEKKIVSLGGPQTPAARNLLAQRRKEEHETLFKEKVKSFDYQLAKAENYYHTRILEMMEEQNEFKKPRIELVTTPKSQKNSEAEEWDYLVSERELKQIECHIRRAEQARCIKDTKCESFPQIPSKTHFPQILIPESKKGAIQKTPSMRKQIREWDWKQQTKEHLERMIRGREFNEERNKERLSVRIPSHPPPFQKHVKKKSHKWFGWNTAYPLLQPQDASPIKVDVFVEESSEENKKEEPKEVYGFSDICSDIGR